MKDASLSVTKALPAANANNQTGTIALPSESGFSNTWRLGRIRINVPALANHTDSTKIITLRLQDSADASAFADTNPAITVNIPGVASTGSLAQVIDVPIPPSYRGNGIQFTQTVPASDGDNTASSVIYSWVNE